VLKTFWYDGMKKHTFEWQEGSLFASPLNCWYQHFNGQADQPIWYVGVTPAPCASNLFSQNFIYNNNFMMTAYYEYRPALSFFPAGRLS
jgi:gentisate 1,2-dioxygenase